MSFLDKNQDVIDIELTLHGRASLARGSFKPVFYRFFDDDIIYNSEYASFEENQNSIENRIFEQPRLRTQTNTESPEYRLSELEHPRDILSNKRLNDNKEAFIEAKLLKYPLYNSKVNDDTSPRFVVHSLDAQFDNFKKTINVNGFEAPIQQINVTASYQIVNDKMEILNNIPEYSANTEHYVDLTNDRITFLDNSKLDIIPKNLQISIIEEAVDNLKLNFDIEFYKKKSGHNNSNLGSIALWQRIETVEELAKYFSISLDNPSRSRDDR